MLAVRIEQLTAWGLSPHKIRSLVGCSPPARPCAAQSCSAWVPAQTIHGLFVRCSITAHPPAWEEAPLDLDLDCDPIAHPEPEIVFDQRVQW